MRKFDRNKWRVIDLKDIILEKVKILGDSVNIKAVSEEDNKGRIIATGFLKGMSKPKEEIHDLKLKLNKITCPTCGKEAGLYYESTLQIRGKMLTNEDLDALLDITRNREGFYSMLNVAGGCDIKVSSKSLAKKLAEYVVKKYKIDKKLSFHLVTKREGRDLYRDTILLRID
jgi:NMD protein affecting ribosome stability and mRNA decay